MALHGDISVNGHVLFTWAARRADYAIAETNDYEVDLYRPNGEGIDNTVLSHRYDDGAIALAAKVLAWAAERGE